LTAAVDTAPERETMRERERERDKQYECDTCLCVGEYEAKHAM